MQVTPTRLPEVLLIEPSAIADARGFFMESWNRRVLREAAGIEPEFVQDNHSRSARGVLRGLHYQLQQPQGKLLRVVRGSIYDVVVDLRRSSPTFGRWVAVELTDQEHAQLWIPPGFAHGFLVLSDSADFLYKSTDYYAPEHERCVLWNDPEVGIRWPLEGEPVLAPKDRTGKPLKEAETFP